MYFPILIILLLATIINAENLSEEHMVIIEEKVAEILTKMAKEDSSSGIQSSILTRLLTDTNLEERVQALEFQMANVQEEIMDTNDDVDVLVSEVSIIHADQVVQDEHLLNVENEVELVGRGVATLEENVNALDIRVTTVESQNDNVTDDLNDLSDRVDILD